MPSLGDVSTTREIGIFVGPEHLAALERAT